MRKPKITKRHLAIIVRLTRERDLARRAVYFVPPKEGNIDIPKPQTRSQ